jgi:hypothetical protein
VKRPVLLVAVAALALCAPLAHAAPTSKPQVVDPAGDALAPGFDVVSARLTTTGVTSTRKVGRKVVRTYTPKTLVASVTLSEPPSTTPGTSIIFHADTTACGNGFFEFQYTPGALLNTISEVGDLFVSGCGPDDTGTGPGEYFSDVLAQVKGDVITWSMPLADMGSDLPLSSVFSGFRVDSTINEPVMGLAGGTDVAVLTDGAAGDVDHATGDAVWKLG